MLLIKLQTICKKKILEEKEKGGGARNHDLIPKYYFKCNYLHATNLCHYQYNSNIMIHVCNYSYSFNLCFRFETFFLRIKSVKTPTSSLF